MQCRFQLAKSGDMFAHGAKIHQLFGEQGMHHAKQQEHITARANVMMGVGHCGGLGTTRIDHHHTSAAGFERFGLAAKIRHRPQTAVGSDRIGTEHDEQIAALDVRHGNRQPGAKHQA